MALTRKKKFLNWVKNHYVCKPLRWEAAKTEVIYDPKHPDPSQRLKVFDVPHYRNKKSFLKKVWENIWVPGSKLRGNSYSDTNFDSQLNQTSTIMSLSSLFDMVCTAPILFYFTKAAGIFALPLSIGYGYFLLIMSNKAGEYSMNRPKENNRTASILLCIFFLLSMVKTLSAGVGIDLVSRSGEIKNLTADNLLEKNFSTSSKSEILYEDLLKSSSLECDRLTENQSQLNTKKRRQLEIYNQLEKSKNKSPINLKSSDPKFLLENYPSDLGACTKKDLINNLNGQNKYKFSNSSKIRNSLYERLPSISSLYLFQRNKFYDMFTGNPLIGSESMFKKYEKEFINSDIDFNLNCINEDECNQNVKWANPGNAINMASKQFYGRIINKEWDSLGLSYIGFLISILLSFTATILLYTSSIDIRNRASRSDKVQEWASEYLLELDEEKIES